MVEFQGQDAWQAGLCCLERNDEGEMWFKSDSRINGKLAEGAHLLMHVKCDTTSRGSNMNPNCEIDDASCQNVVHE